MPPSQTPPGGPNGKKPFNWGRFSKTLSFWILLILIPVLGLQVLSGRNDQAPEVDYSIYDQQLERDNVSRVVVQAGKSIVGEFRQPVMLEGQTRNAKKFFTRLPVSNSDDELTRLRAKGVHIAAEEARTSPLAFFMQIVPWLLILGFWIFLFRQMQAGGAKAFSFGKSKAKLLTGDTPKVTFADVAGAREGEGGLEGDIQVLKDPQKLTKLGGRLPKGCLLIGP